MEVAAALDVQGRVDAAAAQRRAPGLQQRGDRLTTQQGSELGPVLVGGWGAWGPGLVAPAAWLGAPRLARGRLVMLSRGSGKFELWVLAPESVRPTGVRRGRRFGPGLACAAEDDHWDGRGGVRDRVDEPGRFEHRKLWLFVATGSFPTGTTTGARSISVVTSNFVTVRSAAYACGVGSICADLLRGSAAYASTVGSGSTDPAMTGGVDLTVGGICVGRSVRPGSPRSGRPFMRSSFATSTRARPCRSGHRRAWEETMTRVLTGSRVGRLCVGRGSAVMSGLLPRRGGPVVPGRQDMRWRRATRSASYACLDQQRWRYIAAVSQVGMLCVSGGWAPSTTGLHGVSA